MRHEIANLLTHGIGAGIAAHGPQRDNFAIAGTIFYSMARLPYHHRIWHLFVLTGSVLHFLCIYLYV